MTPIADMVEQMLERGCEAGLIVLAVRTAELSGTHVRDMSRTLSQSYEATRKREWRKTRRNQGATEANDAAAASTDVRDMSGTDVPEHCNSINSGIERGLPNKEESKKEVVARGTRLSPDVTLPDDWRAFAVRHGVDPDAAFAEFKDYWIAVPGSRGTKLDWFATWRNRVRNLPKRGKHGSPNRLSATLAKLGQHIDEIDRSEERREPPPRLLSHG